MKIAIHQPQYLPWLGYFDKMDRVDTFVFLDDTQYKKNEWQNRNKIRDADGWQWLTVPVTHEFGQNINETKIDNRSPWRKKHLKSIELNYSRAPYFKKYFPIFSEVLNTEWEFLAELNICFIRKLKDVFGIKTKLVKSSGIETHFAKTEKLIELCKKLKADTYLSGAGGEEYLEKGLFDKNGITLEFQSYKHPVYEQVFKGFHPAMSAVDLLFTEGEKSLGVIRSGRDKV